MTEFLDRFLADYFAESEEHLMTVRRALLSLEDSVGRERPAAAVTEELFRTFHSIKGIAAMVEHRETEQLAHEMESYLRAVRDGDARLTTQGIEALIDGANALERTVAARRQGQPPVDTGRAIALLQRLLPTAVTAASAAAPDGARSALEPSWACTFTPSPALVARGVNVDIVRARLRGVGEILSGVPIFTEEGAVAFRFLFSGTPDEDTLKSWATDGMSCAPYAVANQPVEPDPVPEPAPTAMSAGHYVRVDLARLDDLMRMIGDLVILRARLADSILRAEPHLPSAEWRNIQEQNAAIERQLRELREGVMRVRLVPVGEIFRRMPFVVRDLARDSGRKVKVELTGQSTEIDKFLVERMMDPVLHIVRNAVSHGIESVDERIAAGKPPEGTLSLRASAAGEIVTIDIEDDGRGLDVERIRARAAQAGITVPADADAVTLLDVIASPGFSTRDESDRASGRGTGVPMKSSFRRPLAP